MSSDIYVVSSVHSTEEIFWYESVEVGGSGGCTDFARIQNLEPGAIPQIGQKLQIVDPNAKGQFIIFID